MYRRSMGLGMAIVLTLIALAAIFGGPYIVMIGWNFIIAGMFGGPTLTYWPAFFGTWALHILTERVWNVKVGRS